MQTEIGKTRATTRGNRKGRKPQGSEGKHNGEEKEKGKKRAEGKKQRSLIRQKRGVKETTEGGGD